MTISLILWTAAAIIALAIISAIFRNYGESVGYKKGLRDGTLAKITLIKNNKYEVDVTHHDE